MQELVLRELKIYIQDTTTPSRKNLRSLLRKPFKTSTGTARLSAGFIDIYSKRDPNPLEECSEYYLDDIKFMKKAIKIHPSSIKYASKKIRQNKSIAKLMLKENKKLAQKYIYKNTLKEIIKIKTTKKKSKIK